MQMKIHSSHSHLPALYFRLVYQINVMAYIPMKNEFPDQKLALVLGWWKRICIRDPKIVRFLAQYDHVKKKLHCLENWHSCTYGNLVVLEYCLYNNSLKILYHKLKINFHNQVFNSFISFTKDLLQKMKNFIF